MDYPINIAIDGPAASGKSTLAEKLADHLGYLFFDTGVMYRAVTLSAITELDPDASEEAVTSLARRIQIDVRPPSKQDGRRYDVLLDNEDVTWKIRQPEVEAHVSRVSAYPGVRDAMTSQQRRIGQRGKVVMVGRDIGTVVLPEAELKIYLDASSEERAKRRYQEDKERGKPVDYQTVLEALKKRDEIDSTRVIAPLHPAEDAVIINTDGLNIDMVFKKVVDLVEAFTRVK